MGGLGNQFFQYATGRKIALKNNMPLKLDLSWFKDQPDRPYCLNHFAILEDIATPHEITQLKESDSRLIHKIFTVCRRSGTPYYLRSYIREKSLNFDPDIFQISESTYLDGYWQSEKYFADIEDIIVKELSVVSPPDTGNQNCARMIKSSNAVAVHIRRGDYISN